MPFWRVVLEHRKWFVVFTLAALALRLVFYFRFSHITGDSLIYGDIARNWFDHGIFGLTHAEGVRPTWIRLPGYPAFLVLCFTLFGREHYHAVLLAQIVIDIAGCFVIADLARRTVSARAAQCAFALAALCPFTANYTVAPLAETLSIFFAAVALDAAVAGFMQLDDDFTSWKAWIGCGVAVSAGIQLASRWRHSAGGDRAVSCCGACRERPAQRAQLFGREAGAGDFGRASGSLDAPQLARISPVRTAGSPRYANDPDEFVPSGFDRWVRTWIVDYVSTEEIYWQVPGSEVDLEPAARARI